MKKTYVAPEVNSFGSIHQITGVLVKSVKEDFVYGPSGEIISNGDDHGSMSQCEVSPGVFELCDTQP